jgi:CheY-like chemotaxis protein
MAEKDPTRNPVPVLAVANVHDELAALVEALNSTVGEVEVTTDERRALHVLDQAGPRVVALAFGTLDLSLVFYLRALKLVGSVRAAEWHTVLFCDRMEARRAWEMCRDGVIDDYLVTRPLYDAWQLALAVKQARERLDLKHWTKRGAVPLPGRKSPQQYVEDLETAAVEETARNPRLQRAVAEVRMAVTNLSDHLREGTEIFERARATPDAIAELSASVEAASTPEAAEPERHTVLVIDDDDFARKMVCRTLESGGYAAVAVADGLTALEVLENQAVHVVLMDVEMPGLSGIETTRRLRERWPANALPVIMLTGHGERQTVLEALGAGASDFIVKPGTRAALLAKVQQHLTAVG